MPPKKPWLCVLDRDYDMKLEHIDLLLHVNEEEGETHLDSSTKVHLGGLLLFRAVEKKARKRERKDSSTKVHLETPWTKVKESTP